MQEFEHDVKAWLASKGCSLWADHLIMDDDGLTTAARWFMSQMGEFQRWRMTQYEQQTTVDWDVVA